MVSLRQTRHLLSSAQCFEDDVPMLYPQTYLVLGLAFLFLAGAGYFRVRRLSTGPIAGYAHAWLNVVLLTGVAMIGVSFWEQRISDDNTASSSPDLRLLPPPPSTWMLGVYAAILLAVVGFFMLQLVLFLRSHYRQTRASSGSRDASN
jgi:hypothetical protein